MKTALVTGAGKGIGRAIAFALAQEGFRIAVHHWSSQEAAEQTVNDIRTAGGDAMTFCADLTVPEQVENLVSLVVERWGIPHTLVNNAGVMYSQPLAFTNLEAWRSVHAANLDTAFLLTKALIRPMARQKEGRIIYISSDAGFLGDLMRAAYSSSKAALFGLTKTAARELAASGVTVNAVAPGLIATDMTADMPETRRVRQLAAIPLGRFGTPEEVASVVQFLASERASWITGQILRVDGGLCMSSA